VQDYMTHLDQTKRMRNLLN
jgi:DNA replication licensing factor MCM3